MFWIDGLTLLLYVFLISIHRKLIEAILSALLIVFGMYELVRNMSRKMRIDFIVLILVITVVSLSCTQKKQNIVNFFKSIWEE